LPPLPFSDQKYSGSGNPELDLQIKFASSPSANAVIEPSMLGVPGGSVNKLRGEGLGYLTGYLAESRRRDFTT